MLHRYGSPEQTDFIKVCFMFHVFTTGRLNPEGGIGKKTSKKNAQKSALLLIHSTRKSDWLLGNGTPLVTCLNGKCMFEKGKGTVEAFNWLNPTYGIFNDVPTLKMRPGGSKEMVIWELIAHCLEAYVHQQSPPYQSLIIELFCLFLNLASVASRNESGSASRL